MRESHIAGRTSHDAEMMEEYLQSERSFAEQSGDFALLYIRKSIGTAQDVGYFGRLAARAAARYIYFQSEESRWDSIDSIIQKHTGRDLGAPRTKEDWDRRAVEFVNGVAGPARLYRESMQRNL